MSITMLSQTKEKGATVFKTVSGVFFQILFCLEILHQ